MQWEFASHRPLERGDIQKGHEPLLSKQGLVEGLSALLQARDMTRLSQGTLAGYNQQGYRATLGTK
jgi:hypothetical protein